MALSAMEIRLMHDLRLPEYSGIDVLRLVLLTYYGLLDSP